MRALARKLHSAWHAGWQTALTAWELGNTPPSGHVVVPDAKLDYLQAAVSDNLTFASLRAMIRDADAGNLANGLKLFDEMLEKDATLASVAGTRKKALTGLPYEIVSAAEVEDVEEQEAADEAVDFCRRRLQKIGGLKQSLKCMSNAIGTNLAVCELVWEGKLLSEIVPIERQRLNMQADEPGLVRVITADNRKGIAAVGPKWVVHVPDSTSGWPLTRSILRAQAFVYLTKMVAIADWVIFCEIFGMPIRIAKYGQGVTPEEKTELIEMMANLGSKAFGVFSQAVTIEFQESSQRGTAPFKELIEWCDRSQTKLWLGGNLTSDTTGGTGTHAAAAVQDEVREDLRDGDIEDEGETIREQILRPMCWCNFRRDMPVPYFRRVKPEAIDRMQEGQVMGQAQRIGLKIQRDWAHDRLGIPKPEKGDDVLEPSLDLLGDTINEGETTGDY